MTITLPDEMRSELERKAQAGAFASVGEYIAWLVRTDEAGDTPATPEDLGFGSAAELEAKLLASLNSGPAVEATPEFWANLRKN